MKQFVYKTTKNDFSVMANGPKIHTVNNVFPQFSISIYDFFDGTNFNYKRQIYNDQQILSTLISDDNFSVNNSNDYIVGKSNPNKIFYVKIILFGTCSDTIGTPSNDFIFSITLNNIISYYQIFCINIFNNYAVYYTKFSLIPSDYYSQSDGIIYFNVIGTFNVNISYPINLTINSTNYITPSYITPLTTINQNTSNNTQYFDVLNLNFLTSYRLDYFSLFQYFNYSNSNILFDTSSIVLTVNSKIISIKIDFPNGQNFINNKINYLALTLKNSDVNFNSNSLILNSKIKTQNNIYNIQCNKILTNNTDSSFVNCIFNFKNIFSILDNVNYIIIEIDLNNQKITSPTTISFMNFLKTKNNSFNTFSLESSKDLNYTFDVFGNKYSLSSIHKHLYLDNKDKCFMVESVINLESEFCYEITTENYNIKLDENMLIKGENEFLPTTELNTNTLLTVKSGFEKIKSIKIKTKENIQLLDFDDNTAYCLNGFYVKNPFYLKNFSRSFLKENTDGNIEKIFEINETKVNISNIDNIDLILPGNITNKILIPSGIKKITIIYECDNSVLIKYINKTRIKNKNYIVVDIVDKNEILIRSISDILIKKIITL